MRSACERCGLPLPPDSTEAFVCSFECTFCRDCVVGDLAGVCPNCGGEFSARPRRGTGVSQAMQVQPVLPVRDVRAALSFYTARLGFEGVFVDQPQDPRYAALRRGGSEIHLQWHDAAEWVHVERAALRFLVQDVDRLLAELVARQALPEGAASRDTTWGTREFGIFDPDGNALHFYEALPA